MRCVAALLFLVMCLDPAFSADEVPPKHLLLISQGPDGHPWNTHEFRAGVRILHKLLGDVPGLEITTVDAEESPRDIPKLVDAADGVVLFVSQGSEWVGSHPERLAAFQRLAKRKGGITALHWAVGAKDPRYIDVAKNLWGATHGGPDRKYVVDQRTLVPNVIHPITMGLQPLTIRDEWYYNLKFTSEGGFDALWITTIEDESRPVAWAWERPNRGRSFGFVGLHFHENWGDETYRRFVSRGVLWTLRLEEPEDGLSLELDPRDIQEPRPKPETPER